MDFCLVSLNAEAHELTVGETMRLWVWGVGVESGSLGLEVEGPGSVGLRSIRDVDSWAELVELTVAGETEGRVEISARMVCAKPGVGVDELTLMVVQAETDDMPAAAVPSMDEFCAVQLSVSDEAVAVGDEFFAWFVGAGTVERSWNLEMEGDGSALILGSREIDPHYVEWRLEAMDAGNARLIGTMGCVQGGDGVSAGDVVISERAGPNAAAGISAQGDGSAGGGNQGPNGWGTTAMIQIGLMAGLLVVLGALVYVLIRRR